MKLTKPTESPDIEVIQATHDPIRDFRMDPAGYFLIRFNPDTNKLEAGLCKKDNVLLKKFVGDTPEELCNSIAKTVELMQYHASYMGKELQKAFIAKELGIEYVQDEPLDLSGVG